MSAYLEASSKRRLRSSRDSSFGVLVVMNPGSTRLFPLWQQPQRLQSAGSFAVVLHEIDIDAGFVENSIGGRVVGALGVPG